MLVASICFLATLYHVSIPVRTRGGSTCPGAAFALGVWLLGSFLLREFLTVTAADSRSIYGPLAAPIAVLLWLYILSIAVLVGAALNAAFDTVFAAASEPPGAAASTSGPATPWTRFAACRRPGAYEQSRHGSSSSPTAERSPWWALPCRLLLGIGIIAFTVLLVYVDRGGYRDSNDPPGYAINLVDSIYYTTVTLSTTGYGDIAPVAAARPADQRVRDHAAAHRVPGPADRHHAGGAGHPGPADVPHRPLEEDT